MRTDRSHRHQVTRIMSEGTEQPMPPEPIADRRLYFYGLRGHDDWETAEQYLVDQYNDGEWTPGRYKIEVTMRTVTGVHPVVTIERLLPLHPAYADLPRRAFYGDTKPARAYVHTLVSRYPNTTLEQVAEHVDVFDSHYQAGISTTELTARTGYQPPDGWVRPVSPYTDHVPEDMQ